MQRGGGGGGGVVAYSAVRPVTAVGETTGPDQLISYLWSGLCGLDSHLLSSGLLWRLKKQKFDVEYSIYYCCPVFFCMFVYI